jgi:hypothetical protein
MALMRASLIKQNSMLELDPRKWANEVFGSAALGDIRRTRRLVDYGAREAEALGRSTSDACRGNAAAAEGAYKFVRNPHVEGDAIAESGFQATVRKARAFDVVLAVEDSTTLGYSHSVAEELGPLGGKSDAKTRGFWVHSVLLVAPEPRQVVGLVHQQRWIRDDGGTDGSVAERESRKWEFASECVAERMGEQTARVISVCDREADIYEYLSFKLKRKERFIVRASNNRSLDRLDPPANFLWERIASIPSLGFMKIQVQQRGGRHARIKREVTLKISAECVKLKRPKHLGKNEQETPVFVWAIYAREEFGHKGQEPIEWMLLTTEDASILASAIRIIQYYALRWRIEDFHKAWKSGTAVEDRRMQSPENLERVAIVLAFLAVRILQLAEAYDAEPDAPCDNLLSLDELRVLWFKIENRPLPKSPPSVTWAYQAIAKLGGWLNTKRSGRAGWDAMAKGWLRLSILVEGYRLAGGA